MKYYILFFLSIFTFNFAQELKDAEIELVHIKSKPKIATILKRVNKQLLKKTDTTSFVFNLRQINLKNSDTIINRDEEQIIKITNFNYTFSKKNVIENKDNWFTNFKAIFKNYTAEESPIGWLSGFPIRKNLTTAELDFFIHPNGYEFTREWLENDELLVTFESKGFYKGNFIVDKNYNLLQLNYETQEPYPFFYSSEENIGKNHKFTSNWIYQREKVAMNFEIVKNKMVLKSLSIEEKLRDFTFKRFDEKGVTFTDVNQFYTNIKLVNKKFSKE
ncbi:hypothetical protein [Flavobacterium sp.]|jgi:hypothetical protein|uniref:hypothetical protein n=1 Tax=Flavobacterium sp. TaxID=239 RepID=UPI0037BFAC5C